MKVEIFSSSIFDKPSEKQTALINHLQNRVNEFLALHPDATVKWLQTTFSNSGYAEVTLTAIVSYSDCQLTTDKSD